MSRRHLVLALLLSTTASSPAQWDDGEDFWKDVKIWTGRRPLIDLSYGSLQQALPGLVQETGRRGSIELRLGSSRMDPLDGYSPVLQQRVSALGVAMITTDLASAPDPPALATTSWRVNAWRSDGYGYALNDGADAVLLLGAGGALSWTRLAVDDSVLSPADRELLGLWDGTFRFGSSMEARAGLQVAPLLTIHGGFERSLVYRRHLFGKWLGSAALEGVAGWALDRFLDRIEESAPEALPVVHFVLKNALAYGFSQLRREQMNWPFGSEAPLVDEGFRAGFTFTF